MNAKSTGPSAESLVRVVDHDRTRELVRGDDARRF
jgi:hypothetical protein